MKLCRWRTAKGLTMSEAGKVLRLNQGTVSRLESEERKGSLPLVLQIERLTEGQVRAEDVPMTEETRRALRLLRRSQNPKSDSVSAA